MFLYGLVIYSVLEAYAERRAKSVL